MNRVSQTMAGVGAPFIDLGRRAWSVYELGFETVASMVTFRFSGRQFMEQCYEIGNRSLLFITVTLGVLGFISVYQVGHQVEQILPDFTMMGAAFMQIMVREFGPTMAALMIATRVGSGIAAEIGSMVVTEQVDALRMCNADPVRYLIVPRTLACTLMMVLLTAYGITIATITGMIVADSAFGVHYQTFLNFSLVAPDDLAIGFTKSLCYGFAIPIVAGHSGLNASGGSAGVGWATTRAVVNTSFTVIVLDFIISSLGYLIIL
jgi:phospholipid/cholesterol/gamma-HCH transport system permease protein